MLVVSLLTVLLAVTLTGAVYPQKTRYSRSLTAWTPLPYYYAPRTTRPVYYADTDYYYPQEPYYPVYQVPSYLLDQQRPYYYGYEDVSIVMQQVGVTLASFNLSWESRQV